jgi:hypothetical protein
MAGAHRGKGNRKRKRARGIENRRIEIDEVEDFLCVPLCPCVSVA